MALVDPTTVLHVADRAAYQYGQLKTTFNAIRQQGVGNGYYWEIVTVTDNPDFEIDTLAKYKYVDNDLTVTYAARFGTFLSQIISAMEDHFNRRDPTTGLPLQPGGWDGYLWDHDIRVSQYFAELYHAIYPPYYMYAVDVFSEGDDTFATLNVLAGPTLGFTPGITYGNGSRLNPANGTYFAATQLRAVVSVFGATTLDVRLSVKDVNDNPTTIDFSVPGGTLPGTVIPIGTTSDRFLTVTGAIFKPLGSTGTVGDLVVVKNLKERQIAL